VNLKVRKFKYFLAIATLSTISATSLVNPASAQFLDQYDDNFSQIEGSNPPPGSGPIERSLIRPSDFLPPTPSRVFRRVLLTPNTAGSWNETSPDDPADVNNDGYKDMSYPYYPDHWRDSNGDGTFDQSYDPSSF